MRSTKRFVIPFLLAMGLCGCGGGSSSPAPIANPISLSGLAATGAGIAGATVTVRCVSGVATTGRTDSTGAFTVILGSDSTAPCMLQVSGGTPAVTLYGFAQASGRVNITPATDLIVARALAADPDLHFASFDATKAASITSGLAAAKSYIANQLTAIVGRAMAQDPMTGVFAVGDADDQVLDALAASMLAAGKSHAQLRPEAAASRAIASVVPPFLSTPGNPVATANSSSQITVAWTAVARASSYEVYRSTAPGVSSTATNKLTPTPISAINFVDTGLNADTRYYYRVVANNSVARSADSSEASAKTAAASGGGEPVASTWTYRNNVASNGTFNDVIWTGSTFMSIGTYMASSPDGVAWTLNTLDQGKSIAKSGNILLLAGISPSTGSDIRKSIDGGKTWTVPATAHVDLVTGNGTVFVGFNETSQGQALVVRSSSDGGTWVTRRTEAVTSTQTTAALSKPIWNGSVFLINAYTKDTSTNPFSYSYFVLTSADGVNWTKTSLPAIGATAKVVWNGSQFYLFYPDKFITSADGLNWSAPSSSSIASVIDFVGWTGTELVAFTGGGNSVKVWTSSNGTAWVSRSTTATQPIFAGASSGSIYVAVGTQGSFTSP